MLDKYGSGSLTLAGASTLQTTRVVGGTLQIGPAAVVNTCQLFANDTDQGLGNFSGNGALAINGSVALTGQWAVESNSVLSGTGTVNVSNSPGLNYSSAAASTFGGSIVASGGNASVTVSNGQLTLSGNNSYRGGTTLSGGLLQIGNANALGAPPELWRPTAAPWTSAVTASR